jgi:ABC-type Fe3+/spermidine/putrescine transport system ATPase subunit
MSQPILTLTHVVKRFGDYAAVDDVSIDVREGELFTLLGPSGCGKSTTLRMIAGLEDVDEGEILLRDQPLVSSARGIFVPTQRRNMGMVFQSYAIWPHLTVSENIAYPLELRRIAKAEVNERVAKAIALVGLDGFADRSASALSGGQQQRVALARALVYEPDILLLDEPFSSLDVKLREQLRVELRMLQRRIGVTVVMVTHDQTEALSLSDRIAVMSNGKVEQVGSPHDLYERPATPFVRDFLGRSNKMAARFVKTRGNGEIEVSLADCGTTIVGQATENAAAFARDQSVTVSIRPEDVQVLRASKNGGHNELAGVVEAELYMGDHSECYIRTGAREIVSLQPRGAKLREGEAVVVHLPEEAVRIWS